MKIHNKEIGGKKVQAWNDSNVEWVVQYNGHTDQYDKKKWTLKDAIDFSVELWGRK